jgi:hypothetical protein
MRSLHFNVCSPSYKSTVSAAHIRPRLFERRPSHAFLQSPQAHALQKTAQKFLKKIIHRRIFFKNIAGDANDITCHGFL